MDLALLLVAVAVTVLTVTAIAGRIGFAAPIPLILVGWAGSYLPGVPTIHLEPEVVLLGLLPPLLYAAALGTSLVDFNANRRPILLLSVGLVAFTTAGVAVVVHAILPEVGWAAAFAIGAVVAPPDAVAATAIGRRIGLPRRIVTILEGESLLNDATALVALRTAIAAIGSAGAMAPAWEIGLDFALAAGGGLAVGIAGFVLVAKIRKHLTDPVLDTGISLVVPFATYIAAEEIHASGVVAVVVAGLLLGHKAAILQTAQSRIAERVNWRTLAFMLENTVFLLIGLQAALAGRRRPRQHAARQHDRGRLPRHARRRRRTPDGVGVPRALPADPARAGPGDRAAAAGVVHVPGRVGRDARCGHARRRVHHPGDGAAP